MASPMKRIYGFVQFVQYMFLFVFLADNFTTLNHIHYSYSLGGSTEVLTVNFYAILGFVFVLGGIIILSGLSLFGSGLSDNAQKTLSKLVGGVAILAILAVSSSFYILHLGSIGVFIEFLFVIIHGVGILQGITDSGGDTTDA